MTDTSAPDPTAAEATAPGSIARGTGGHGLTTRSVHAGERARRGIADSMIRLSVGLEDTDDLIADLAQALYAP